MSYRRGLHNKVAVTWTECMNCEISLYLRLCLQVCIHIYVNVCMHLLQSVENKVIQILFTIGIPPSIFSHSLFL